MAELDELKAINKKLKKILVILLDKMDDDFLNRRKAELTGT